MRLLVKLATLVLIGTLTLSASAQTRVRVGYLPATHDTLLFVHLLRWLVLGRPILVLDEAFSALDQPLKGMVRDAIHRHTKAFGISVVNISHDRADVLQVSDRVFFVENKRIIENATPRQLFFAPTSKDLAEFLGHTNLFHVQINPEDRRLVSVQRDVYRDVMFPEPETLKLEQGVSAVYIERSGDEPRIAEAGSPHAARDSGIFFIPSGDVNVTAIENGESIQGDNLFKIESMRFTGTHYDMRLVRESVGGLVFRIDAIVQDDDLMKLLPSGVSQDQLVNRRVAVSFVRAIMLPGVGGI